MIPTGSTEYTKANNIYDLSGNTRKFTMESTFTDARSVRGGNYQSTVAISNRSSGSPTGAYIYDSYRAILYIK